MRRLLACLVICVLLCPPAGLGEEPASFFADVESDRVGKIIRSYDSPTLKYTVESFTMEGERCYLTRVWVQDPARQIRKATSTWKKNLKHPKVLAEKIPDAALVINGSGYVSPQYPEIPENYPGTSEDYFYTPLGSLTVTDGEVFRNLEGVSYYGLTLDADGLQMYTGADNAEVLATEPVQTWSFYTGRVDKHNYLILSVDISKKDGLSLRRASVFFRESFRTEWVYDLDGGPSSALICRKRGNKKMHTVMGGGAKDADIMAFIE